MHKHQEKKLIPYSPEQLFSIVADVEKYPDFLPWVTNSEIKEHKKNSFVATLTANFKAFKAHYTSKVILKKAKNINKENSFIEVELIEGPFKHLHNSWVFEPNEKGTMIHFSLDFQLKSFFLEKVMGVVFDYATRKMVSSFEKRAEEIYG